MWRGVTLCFSHTLNTVLAAAPLQLMSELVRKAEADINGLRVKLAAVGTAPRADLSATSQSAALLQVRFFNGSWRAASFGVRTRLLLVRLQSLSRTLPAAAGSSPGSRSGARTLYQHRRACLLPYHFRMSFIRLNQSTSTVPNAQTARTGAARAATCRSWPA